MYYQIQDSISKIELKDVNPDLLTLGIISLDELEQCYKVFGFSEATIAVCRHEMHHIHGSLEVYGDYYFGIMTGINAQQIIKVQDRIGLYIKSNLFLVVIIEDTDESISQRFFELLEHLNPTKLNLERVIYGFFERLIVDDYTLLEKIESEISTHEDEINERKLARDFNYQITEIRKKLLLLDNYYQQLVTIGEKLTENGADLLEENNLHYFRMYTDRVSRLISFTRMLQEYCVHVRESYHAQLDYDLNNIMKIFTVITTIFLPLTLIVGWYGMNFTTMPELTWKYGYLFVILASILVVIICYLYMKRKKFL